jgi:hypothetical protein
VEISTGVDHSSPVVSDFDSLAFGSRDYAMLDVYSCVSTLSSVLAQADSRTIQNFDGRPTYKAG